MKYRDDGSFNTATESSFNYVIQYPYTWKSCLFFLEVNEEKYIYIQRKILCFLLLYYENYIA